MLDSKNNAVKGDINKKYKIKILDNFNNNKFDIVFITNPSSFHIKTLLKLKNQKNLYIFIEKPIDVNLKRIGQLNKLIKKNNFKIFVGCNLRFTEPYKILKKN